MEEEPSGTIQRRSPMLPNEAKSNIDATAGPPQSPLPPDGPAVYLPRPLSRRALTDAANMPAISPPVSRRCDSIKCVSFPESPSCSSDGSTVSSTSTSTDCCSLTPPVSGPRPLVVSAKRLGQDVRRKHSKRRRCRSRRGTMQQNGNENDAAAFCLWKENKVGGDCNDNHELAPAAASSDEETLDSQDLPFLFSQQELSPQEQTRRYWELCYGNTVTIEPLTAGNSWSANRAPPRKSW